MEKDNLRHRLENHSNEIADKLYPFLLRSEAQELEKEGVVAFMISRHPFHRVISAYRDKLERIVPKSRDGDYFYRCEAHTQFNMSFVKL